MTLSPFDFLNSINQTKKNLMDNDPQAEKEYAPWMVNRGLSYFPDTVLYANELNMHYNLDHKMQYQYLMHSIKPKKRFSKWHKNQLNPELELIKQFFGYSNKRAEEVLDLFTKEQLEEIKEHLNTGGVKTKK